MDSASLEGAQAEEGLLQSVIYLRRIFIASMLDCAGLFLQSAGLGVLTVL